MSNFKELIKTWKLKGFNVAIDDVVTSYSTRLSSHKAAWPNLIASKIRFFGLDTMVLDKNSNWNDYDVILICLPMEFQGSFNVFGGANDELAERLAKFTEFEGKLFICDKDMPDIGEFIKSRKSSCSEKFAALNEEEFTKICKKVERVDTIMGTKKMIVGDSHSISVYRPGYDISRNDGKTLHGALKDGLSSFLLPETEEAVFYFGNIDIRHHIYRQDDLRESAYKLLNGYEKQLRDLNLEKLAVVGALWVESEERKLPKTGYYKGTPFFGSAERRARLVKWWNMYLQDMCHDYGWKYIGWPEYMLNSDNRLDFQYMEKPKSVHLSREYYHFDFETNSTNKKFFKK